MVGISQKENSRVFPNFPEFSDLWYIYFTNPNTWKLVVESYQGSHSTLLQLVCRTRLMLMGLQSGSHQRREFNTNKKQKIHELLEFPKGVWMTTKKRKYFTIFDHFWLILGRLSLSNFKLYVQFIYSLAGKNAFLQATLILIII